MIEQNGIGLCPNHYFVKLASVVHVGVCAHVCGICVHWVTMANGFLTVSFG